MSGGRHSESCGAARGAEAALDEAVRRAFWQSLHQAPLPAMRAMEVAARAVGALYRQMAEAHEGPAGCACGWEPDRDGDLIVLEANLAAALLHRPEPDLAGMSAVGRA